MNVEYLNSKIESSHLNSHMLLSRAKMLDSASRESPAFNDCRCLPFYYHLGTQISPKKVLQIGSKIGLIGACFLQSCSTVELWQVGEDSSSRSTFGLICSNLRLFGKAQISCVSIEEITEEKANLGLLTELYHPEKFKEMLELLWRRLDREGLLVVDYIQDEAAGVVFKEFCVLKNRVPTLFDTRYGVGIVQR
jgi:hypothetical protein